MYTVPCDWRQLWKNVMNSMGSPTLIYGTFRVCHLSQIVMGMLCSSVQQIY